MPLDDSPNEKNSSVQEHVEDARTTESDVRSNQDNATVVLDIGAKTLEGSDLNRLKVAKDGHTVLVPQPSDDPDDPLNWSWWKKHGILITIGMCTFLLDFQAGASIACLIPQGLEWGLSPDHVLRAANLNVIMIGVGGILLMPFLSFWGRAPVVFWTILCGTLFTLGCTLSPSFGSYYTLKALQGLALVSGLTSSLAYIEDMFFLHERARKIGIWSAMWLASPYFGPMFSNFIISRTGEWKNVFYLLFGLGCLDILLIVAFLDESWYRRDISLENQPSRHNRVLRVAGVWQIRVHRGYFGGLLAGYRRLLALFLSPIIITISVSSMMALMWVIGINQTSAILFLTPAEVGGYGFSLSTVGFIYFAPILGIILGEVFGHFFIDFAARRYVRKHGGIIAPEARLGPIYVATIFMVPGLVLVGQALSKRLSWLAVAFGWGMYTFGAILEAVSSTAYAIDSYPHAAGEISALLNFVRLVGGFAVGYFQIPWGVKSGFDVSFGIQAAIVGVSTLMLPILHVFGRRMRRKGGPLKL